MVNAKPIIATALSTDTAFIALIPQARMFDGSAVFSNAPIYPYLTYDELANIEALHADDESIEDEVTFRIHLWGTASLSVMAGHVDRIMRTINFGRNYSMDSDEILDIGQVIKHKILSFSNTYSI